MKLARSLGAVALVIALLAAGVAVCPCAEQPSNRDHGCCAQGTALRAAGSDCCARGDAALGVAPSADGALVLLQASIPVPLPVPAPAPRDAFRRGASLVPASPPTILRI